MLKRLQALLFRMTGQIVPKPSNVICEGSGRVGTTVENILGSPKFQEQIRGVKEIAVSR